MERISDEQLDTLIDFLAEDIKTEKRPVFFVTHAALVELRERRQSDKASLAKLNAQLEREFALREAATGRKTGYLPNFPCPNCHDFMVRQDTDCLRCIKCHWTNL